MREVALITHYDLSYFRGGEKFIINLANALSEESCTVKVYSLPLNRRNNRVVDVRRYLSKNIEYECIIARKKVEVDISYYVYAPFVYNRFMIKDSSPLKIAGIHGFAITPQLSHPEVWKIPPAKFINIHGFKAFLAFHYNYITRQRDLFRYDLIHIINPFQSIFLPEKLSKRIIYIPLWTNYRRRLPHYTDTEEDEYFRIAILGCNDFRKGYDICKALIKYFGGLKNLKIRFYSNSSNLYYNYPWVVFVGFINEEELPKILSQAHVLLHPSRLDTFGLVIIESLACGTPVVTSDILAHRIFSHPVFLCSSLSDYISRIGELYKLWKEGGYEQIRKEAEALGRRFSKENVFPIYRRLLFKC